MLVCHKCTLIYCDDIFELSRIKIWAVNKATWRNHLSQTVIVCDEHVGLSQMYVNILWWHLWVVTNKKLGSQQSHVTKPFVTNYNCLWGGCYFVTILNTGDQNAIVRSKICHNKWWYCDEHMVLSQLVEQLWQEPNLSLYMPCIVTNGNFITIPNLLWQNFNLSQSFGHNCCSFL